MKILITGASGFVGHSLQESFKSYEAEHQISYISSSDADLTKPYDASRLISSLKPDIILHCAAKAGGIKANTNSPATFISDNLAIAVNLYKEAAINKVKKIYSLGSCCSFANTSPIPTKESDLWENGLPQISNMPYGIAKRALWAMSYAYREQYGIGGAYIISANLYGIEDHFDLTNSHVVPALIRKIYDAKKKGKKEIAAWGSGLASRDLLFVRDLTDTLAQLVMNGFDYCDPINIGSEQEITIKELANKIAELIGYEGSIIFESDEMMTIDGQPRRLLDCSLAHRLFNYSPKISLDQGLKKTIDWYIEHIYPYID